MKKKTTEQFVKNAKKIHRETYDYSGVRYFSAIAKVGIMCRSHGLFWQTPNDHLSGKGCPACGVERGATSRTKSKDDFANMARKVHGDVYDYSVTEYVSAKNKVKIVCREHGEFLVTPDNHIRKASGCPKCGNIARAGKTSLRLRGKTHNNFVGSVEKRRDDFLSKSKKVHGDRYDYSLVEYKSGKGLVKLICEKHGVFKTLPSKHLLGSGCPRCVREEHRNHLQSEFVDNSMRVHGGKYGYEKVDYQTSNNPVIIVCPLHGEFSQKPSKHLYVGHGCPKCNSSHGERLIREWLTKKAVGFEEQKVFSRCVNPISGHRLKFDFYIPSLTTCVEFDGEQHFRPWRDGRILADQVVKIQIRDKIKDGFCKSEGIRLLRIPYYDLSRVYEILERELAA